MTARKLQSDAFITLSGWGQSDATLLAGDASNRRYDRLTFPNGKTAILMDAPPNRGEDVRPFVRIAEYLNRIGLSAPKILARDLTNGFLLIEDLGDDLFARMMKDDPDCQQMLYRAATDVLNRLHAADPLTLPQCDATWLTDMTAPVFEWYLDGETDAVISGFQRVFFPMAAQLDATKRVVILRDYHAENLLWLRERIGTKQVGLLDFQDALLGHPAYDLVSILQDARRDVAPDLEAEMIAHYLNKTDINAPAFHTAYALLGAQRNLRILGIFARLCLRDGKPHYIDLIPRVWGYVMRNLAHPALAPLAEFIDTTLPRPTPDHLEHLKSQCATTPTP